MFTIKKYASLKHPSGYSGVNNIARVTKASRREIAKTLSKSPAYTLHREVKKPRYYNPFIIYSKRDLIQGDLIDLQKFSLDNEGFKYILILCDTLTRKAWATPLKDKTSATVLKAFETLHRDIGSFKRFMTDAGGEFKSGAFQKYLQVNNIAFIRGNPHAPHVERLNRTLQNIIYRRMTHLESRDWKSTLSDVIRLYNNRHHRTIKMSPQEAEQSKNMEKLLKHVNEGYEKILAKRKKPKYKVGDLVVIQKLRQVFAKGYEQIFTHEMFYVQQVHTSLPIPMYTLQSYDRQETIEGRFYENELQEVDFSVFKIESVLKERTKKGVKEILVKWKGWPERYNQWIPKSNLVS